MKTINHAINGLASSLFLNVGLTRIAEKLDTTAQNTPEVLAASSGVASSEDCIYVCNFTPESGQ